MQIGYTFVRKYIFIRIALADIFVRTRPLCTYYPIVSFEFFQTPDGKTSGLILTSLCFHFSTGITRP